MQKYGSDSNMCLKKTKQDAIIESEWEQETTLVQGWKEASPRRWSPSRNLNDKRSPAVQRSSDEYSGSRKVSNEKLAVLLKTTTRYKINI